MHKSNDINVIKHGLKIIFSDPPTPNTFMVKICPNKPRKKYTNIISFNTTVHIFKVFYLYL